MHIDTSRILSQSVTYSESSNKRYENIFAKEISISFLINKNHFKSRFFSEIAILLSSGMDIKKSLEIILNGLVKKKEKDLLTSIINTIVNGSTLADAIEKARYFTIYDSFSIKIGEESGSLGSVLKELANYYSKKIIQQRQIKGALTYPILVLVTTIFSLAFMLNFIVPMFEDVFLRFRGNLPPITRAVIAFSNSFSVYAVLGSIIIISIIIFHLFYKKKKWYRKMSSNILLKVPIVGPIINLTYKTRFCQTMKLLIGSKVHLLEAIGLIKQMIGFYPFENALEEIKTKLANGIPFSAAMEEYPIFDKKLVSMSRVAEEVNKLDVVYEQLYLQYSEELDTKIKTMNNLLEPILIIFVGGIVALILVSMYMPIFQIGTGIF